MLILSWKTAPALAMGNSVVAKPAEVTPLTALALAELAVEAGLPPGVFNVVTGRGSEAGEALVRHPKVSKISFTGSTEVGSGVMAAAAPDIKRVSLELGGKSASIVFSDADLDVCVESSIFAVYDNAGQDCCARSRILVQKQIFDEFTDRFVDAGQAGGRRHHRRDDGDGPADHAWAAGKCRVLSPGSVVTRGRPLSAAASGSANRGTSSHRRCSPGPVPRCASSKRRSLARWSP